MSSQPLLILLNLPEEGLSPSTVVVRDLKSLTAPTRKKSEPKDKSLNRVLHHEISSEVYTKPNQNNNKELFGRSWYYLIIDLLIHQSVGQRIHVTLVSPHHVIRVPNKIESLVWDTKLSSHISSVNYFTSAVKENRCNEQLIIQNNHPQNPIPSLNIFRGRSTMVGFIYYVNRVHWSVSYTGPPQPSCTPLPTRAPSL